MGCAAREGSRRGEVRNRGENGESRQGAVPEAMGERHVTAPLEAGCGPSRRPEREVIRPIAFADRRKETQRTRESGQRCAPRAPTSPTSRSDILRPRSSGARGRRNNVVWISDTTGRVKLNAGVTGRAIRRMPSVERVAFTDEKRTMAALAPAQLPILAAWQRPRKISLWHIHDQLPRLHVRCGYRARHIACSASTTARSGSRSSLSQLGTSFGMPSSLTSATDTATPSSEKTCSTCLTVVEFVVALPAER